MILLFRSLLLALMLMAAMSGCAYDGRSQDRGDRGISVAVMAPIRIPPGRAHTILQQGRLASASNKLNPYCELEVRTVAPKDGAWVSSGEFRVAYVRHRLLLDPTTRIPALTLVSSCSDPVFQESIWQLTPALPSDVMYLRCIAPYYNCAFGPPLSLGQVQQQVGRYMAIEVRTVIHTGTPEQRHRISVQK
ncbi:MAG: hypothetical protein VBE63_20495, partial [Lamprobacter sp.]|uniref:hypothetical protein n=1 Tax=Lamprobacter sp. TaxID=3100796 RepID=UPI002B25AF44